MSEHIEPSSQKHRYVRRGFGILVGYSPLILLAASLVHAIIRGGESHTIGVALIAGALAIGCVNFYLSFLQALVHRWRRGTLDGYKHVSGVPIFGTVLVVLGTFVGFGSALGAALGLLAVALDTGGSIWFLIATWRDSSLWDQ